MGYCLILIRRRISLAPIPRTHENPSSNLPPPLPVGRVG